MSTLSFLSLETLKPDLKYSYRPVCPSNKLIDSIKEHGIMTPISVYKQADQFFVWDGFRRLQAANICKISSVACCVYQKEKPVDFFKTHYIRNTYHEKTHLLERCQIHHLSEKYFKNELDSLANLSPLELKFMKDYLKLSEDFYICIEQSLLSEYAIRFLIQYFHDTSDIESILKLIINYKMSYQNQKLFLDIVLKLKKNKSDLISQLNIFEKSIYELNPNAPSHLRLKLFFDKISIMAHPQLSQLESNFEISKKNLHLPNNIACNHYNYFSKPGFQLTWNINSIKDWDEGFKKISSIHHEKKYHNFFKL